jgi:hypothetical protein
MKFHGFSVFYIDPNDYEQVYKSLNNGTIIEVMNGLHDTNSREKDRLRINCRTEMTDSMFKVGTNCYFSTTNDERRRIRRHIYTLYQSLGLLEKLH